MSYVIKIMKNYVKLSIRHSRVFGLVWTSGDPSSFSKSETLQTLHHIVTITSLKIDITEAIQSVVVTGHFITGTNPAIGIPIYETMQNQ